MENQTPIFEALVRHVQQSRLPLHVPGHKQGRLLPHEFAAWLGTGAKLDLTELPGLDNFHSPSGIIEASQTLAASVYQADWCAYSLNGSTAAIMASIRSCTEPGDKVLFIGPFHLSAWRGLVYADAEPIFFPLPYDDELGAVRPIGREGIETELQRRIEDEPRCKALYVTSPTYQGFVAPIATLARVAHSCGIPLIVDEAHGAHFGMHPDLPKHSIEAGADLVVQSTHKMLPALTQTAWVLGSGTLVSHDRLARDLRFLHTTSPSYLLLASLDVTQAWLRSEARDVISQSLSMVRGIQRIHATDAVPFDPYRVWIPTGNLENSTRLRGEFERHGVFVEYADYFGVLAIFGLGATKAEVSRLRNVMEPWLEQQKATRPAPEVVELIHHSQCPCLEMTPAVAARASTKWVKIADAGNEIAGDLVVPYPPGIPLLWPGQRITPELCTLLDWMTMEGWYEIQGIQDGRIPIATSSS